MLLAQHTTTNNYELNNKLKIVTLDPTCREVDKDNKKSQHERSKSCGRSAPEKREITSTTTTATRSNKKQELFVAKQGDKNPPNRLIDPLILTLRN